MAAIIFLHHHHQSRAVETSPRTLKLAGSRNETNPHKSYLICSFKNKVGSGARLQGGPQLAPRRKKTEESPRTFCSDVCFYFLFVASTPTFSLGWWTIIRKEPDSLIIRCVPLWSRPHCLSAQFLSSTEMIASFFFFFNFDDLLWCTRENIQMWFRR